MSLEIKVVKERDNPLLHRKEIEVIIEHPGQGTPRRVEIRKKIAAMYAADIDRVYVKSLLSEFGIARTRGVIHIYNTKEDALAIEPKYIIERNKLPEETKEKE
ncbi:MAG: 30S ribosomal protein S24e [Candidatus Baldrarchaeia archaeon]